MFCSKCGAKAIDGAVFCQKCGAKLIQGSMEAQSSVPIQAPVEMSILSAKVTSESDQKTVMEKEMETTMEEDIHEESPAILGSDADIYAILKNNIDICPAIKSAKQVKTGVRLCGRIYSHSVRLVSAHADQARIRSILAFPLSILYALPVGLLCCITWIILAELMKYSTVCIEYYHGILFALCCLVSGIVVLIHSLVGRKEKVAVAAFVREVIEPKKIFLFTGKKRGMSKIRNVVAVVLILAGIIVLPFNLPNLAESIKYPDELLHDGLPVTRFLEMTQEDVESEFGEPWFTGQHIITGDDYHDYACSTGRPIHKVVYSKETGKVIYIQFYSDYCSCNGKKLNKSEERVLNILSKRYKGGYYSFGVYGSKHSGFFYYNEAVYFGEVPDVEEILAQREFEDGRYGNYRFRSLNAYGDEYYDSGLSLNVRGKQDYKIDLIFSVGMNDVSYVCLYTDEWIETLNAGNENAVTDNEAALSFDASEIINMYEGSWWDIYSQRANMTINHVDTNGGYFDISISWSSSASELTEWYLEGIYEDGGIHYYGQQVEWYVDDPNGGAGTRVVSEAEEGFLWIGDDNMLYWDNYNGEIGGDCAFEKSVY